MALLLGACASVPPVEVKAGSNWIRVADVSCNCNGSDVAKSPDAALRAAVQQDAAAYEYARKVGAAETALTRRPATAGNQVELLVDGPAAHAAQLSAIRTARHHIHLDIYIITDEKIGQQYAEVLSERARAGVIVRLMFDSIGGSGAGEKFKTALKDAGVQLLEFHKTDDLRVWRINRRSHRKLLIVDGKIAFTGGINIMDEYTQSSPAGAARGSGGASGSSRASSGSGGAGMRLSQLPVGAGWRDTHIQVEGPAVAAFQRAFLEAWEAGKGEIDLSGAYFPPQRPSGNEVVRVITSEGTDLLSVFLAVPESVAKALLSQREKRNVIYGTYFNAIKLAQKRVWITQSYFAPNEDFVDLLRETAQRGVDVRLLLPAKSDVGYLPLITRHYYDRLLKSGIKIYEYEPVMLHAKTAVVDGVWSTVGSANLDYRSFIHNDEANAVVIGKRFGGKMEALFEQDMAHSTSITLKQWRARPWVERIKETGASLIKYWI